MGHNLPPTLTSFVGRESEIAECRQRLGRTRLLTLLGAGGVGKSRLAGRIGLDLVERYAGGVWLVELASLDDSTLVLRAAATTLAIYEEPDRDLLDTMVDALRARGPLLLILDNCEHVVIGVSAIVNRLLRGCPRLTILTTSREPLGVPGEAIHRVPSLALPDDTPGSSDNTLAALQAHEATRLFLERAGAVREDVVVTPESAQAIAQICRRLDGIPLAIELAAARMRVLTAQQIAARLDDRFLLLTDGGRTADPRQRTLRATIDWSYALLSEPEQAVLQRLSVFAGACTLEAIEAICDDVVASDDTLDLVTRLADRSLVVADLSGAEARYRLLETIRVYALERLEAGGDAERVRRRHAEYFLRVAEEAGPRVRLADGRRWLDRLQAERDNLRAALACGAEATDDRDLMPRIAGALWWYWYLGGNLTEGRHWLERALDIVEDPAVHLAVLTGASILAFSQDDYARARAHALESVSMGRACGDQRAVVWALTGLGQVASRTGDVDRALSYCDEGLTLGRQVGDAEAIAHALFTYGNAIERTGSYDRAEAFYAECERWARAADHAWFLPMALHGLAKIAALRDDVDRATALCAEALALIRQTGNFWSELPTLEVVIRVAQRRADIERVIMAAHQVGSRYREIGNPGGIALVASPLAWVAHHRGDELRAARLLGAADALMAVSGRVRLPGDQADYDAHRALVWAALGDKAYSAAWAEGRAMTSEQAVEYTLRRDDGHPGDPTTPDAVPAARPHGAPTVTPARDLSALTPREADVVRLIARSLTNRQIADELVISERTASSHVYRLLGKLGFTSRAQVAAWAARHGLGEPDA